MPEDDDDPRRVIAAFLSGLPQTIKKEVLLLIITYAIRDRKLRANPKGFEQAVLNFLTCDGIDAIGAIICTLAVLDHSLEGFAKNRAESALRTMADRHPDNVPLRRAHLSAPLRKRHFEQAFSDWRHLRETKLAPERLQDFERNQLNPRRSL